MIVHDAPNKLKIERIWVVVSVDANGNEGVCAGPLPGAPGVLMPLIAADEERLPFIKDMAKRLSKHTKKTLRLIELSTRTNVEDFVP